MRHFEKQSDSILGGMLPGQQQQSPGLGSRLARRCRSETVGSGATGGKPHQTETQSARSAGGSRRRRFRQGGSRLQAVDGPGDCRQGDPSRRKAIYRSQKPAAGVYDGKVWNVICTSLMNSVIPFSVTIRICRLLVAFEVGLIAPAGPAHPPIRLLRLETRQACHRMLLLLPGCPQVAAQGDFAVSWPPLHDLPQLLTCTSSIAIPSPLAAS